MQATWAGHAAASLLPVPDRVGSVSFLDLPRFHCPELRVSHRRPACSTPLGANSPLYPGGLLTSSIISAGA